MVTPVVVMTAFTEEFLAQPVSWSSKLNAPVSLRQLMASRLPKIGSLLGVAACEDPYYESFEELNEDNFKKLAQYCGKDVVEMEQTLIRVFTYIYNAAETSVMINEALRDSQS